nr:hypothetical protein [Halomicronema hongdechloris]
MAVDFADLLHMEDGGAGSGGGGVRDHGKSVEREPRGLLLDLSSRAWGTCDGLVSGLHRLATVAIATRQPARPRLAAAATGSTRSPERPYPKPESQGHQIGQGQPHQGQPEYFNALRVIVNSQGRERRRFILSPGYALGV